MKAYASDSIIRGAWDKMQENVSLKCENTWSGL